MRRALIFVAPALILIAASAVEFRGAPRLASPGRGPETRLPLPSTSQDLPLTVLVKGWLWDANSRGSSWAPIRDFQPRVNEILEAEHGYPTTLIEYQWSRLPRDVVRESNRFTQWARQLSEQSTDRPCINFIGHSAGAAFVYNAASQGVPMGFMGTLGLPTFGQGRPPKVHRWANFFTSAHPDDIAGKLWGQTIAADLNVDIGQEHRRFWTSPEVARTSADGIAQAWVDCRTGNHEL